MPARGYCYSTPLWGRRCRPPGGSWSDMIGWWYGGRCVSAASREWEGHIVVKVNLNEVGAILSSYFKSRSLSDSSHKKGVVYPRYSKPALISFRYNWTFLLGDTSNGLWKKKIEFLYWFMRMLSVLIMDPRWVLNSLCERTTIFKAKATGCNKQKSNGGSDLNRRQLPHQLLIKTSFKWAKT